MDSGFDWATAQSMGITREDYDQMMSEDQSMVSDYSPCASEQRVAERPKPKGFMARVGRGLSSLSKKMMEPELDPRGAGSRGFSASSVKAQKQAAASGAGFNYRGVTDGFTSIRRPPGKLQVPSGRPVSPPPAQERARPTPAYEQQTTPVYSKPDSGIATVSAGQSPAFFAPPSSGYGATPYRESPRPQTPRATPRREVKQSYAVIPDHLNKINEDSEYKRQYTEAQNYAVQHYTAINDLKCAKIAKNKTGKITTSLVKAGCDVSNVDFCTLLQKEPSSLETRTMHGLVNPMNSCFYNAMTQLTYRHRQLAMNLINTARSRMDNYVPQSVQPKPVKAFRQYLIETAYLSEFIIGDEKEGFMTHIDSLKATFNANFNVCLNHLKSITTEGAATNDTNMVGEYSFHSTANTTEKLIHTNSQKQDQMDTEEYEHGFFQLQLVGASMTNQFRLEADSNLFDNMPPEEYCMPNFVDFSFIEYFQRIGGFFNFLPLIGSNAADWATINLVLFGEEHSFFDTYINYTPPLEGRKDANVQLGDSLLLHCNQRVPKMKLWTTKVIEVLTMEAMENGDSPNKHILEFIAHVANFTWFVQMRRYNFAPILAYQCLQYVTLWHCTQCDLIESFEVNHGYNLDFGVLAFFFKNNEKLTLGQALDYWRNFQPESGARRMFCKHCNADLQMRSVKMLTRLPIYLSLSTPRTGGAQNIQHQYRLQMPFEIEEEESQRNFDFGPYILNSIQDQIGDRRGFEVYLPSHVLGVVIYGVNHYVALTKTRHVLSPQSGILPRALDGRQQMDLPKPGCWFTFNDHVINVTPEQNINAVLSSMDVTKRGKNFLLKLGTKKLAPIAGEPPLYRFKNFEMTQMRPVGANMMFRGKVWHLYQTSGNAYLEEVARTQMEGMWGSWDDISPPPKPAGAPSDFGDEDVPLLE